MGISWGVPSSKAPLNTGRADYFGSTPNLAARLMAVAQVRERESCRGLSQRGSSVWRRRVRTRPGAFGPRLTPTLSSALLPTLQPGQVLIDGRLGDLPGLRWREDGGALLITPASGALEFTALGYLQVKARFV